MGEHSSIPLIVVARQPDAVETINSTLRNAGHAVHCTWIRDLADLADAMLQVSPRLVFGCLADEEDTAALIEVRNRIASAVPVVVVRDALDEQSLARALELGARDLVTLQSRSRLRCVAERELEAVRLGSALAGTLASAQQYRDQMKAFMTGSADAIAHVQEGIVVDANPAWVELLGRHDPAELLGQPLMDVFDPGSHAALKGALVAAAQGRWAGHPLEAVAVLPGGATVTLELELERFEFEAEPAVRLRVATHKRDLASMARQLEEAMRFNPDTGLLKRSTFLPQAESQARLALKGGIRAMVYLEIDKSQALETELGPVAHEDLLIAVGRLLRTQLQPGDAAARVAPRGFAILVERGNARDLDAWATHLLRRLAGDVLQGGDRSVTVTGSIGLAACDPAGDSAARALAAAVKARAAAATAGGNRLQHDAASRDAAAEQDGDRHWAAQIKSALMANRFRLVHQPIASLLGEDRAMFDLVVRMLDEQGREVLPSEFLAAAERTDLLKNIDRWVIGAAMTFCAARQPHRVFVRVSRDSVRDPSLGAWLRQQLRSTGVDPGRVVVEIGEELATQQLKEIKTLQALLAELGFELAIEGFGAGRAPEQLLNHVTPKYVKIDGSLMQGIANDRPLQERVKALADEARSRGITTIAERVEDANTMAVLWQLGIEFIQGYFVASPEDVVLGN